MGGRGTDDDDTLERHTDDDDTLEVVDRGRGEAAVTGTPTQRHTDTHRHAQDLASGDANLPVTRGGASEAEEALDELEAEILSQLSPAGLAGGGSDEDT